MREEAADHLRQAIAADESHDRVVAERRAIAEFGDAHAIAGEFVAISLARSAARLRTGLIIAVAVIFVAMKGRVAWYIMTGWSAGHDVSPATQVIAVIDRYAFWSSAIIAIGVFGYLAARPVAPAAHRGLRRKIRRVLLLGAAAIAPLVLAVMSDGMLTWIQLMGADLSARSLVPIATMAAEIACIGILSLEFASMRRRGGVALDRRAG